MRTAASDRRFRGTRAPVVNFDNGSSPRFDDGPIDHVVNVGRDAIDRITRVDDFDPSREIARHVEEEVTR
jgi:hypothetical protein